MTTTVTVELVCAVFLGILFITQTVERVKTKSSRRLNICILLVLCTLAIDAMAYYFMDDSTPFAFRYAVCLLAYVGEGIFILGFAYYSEAFLAEKTAISPWIFRILRIAELLWILATVGAFVSGKMVVFENGIETADNGYPAYLMVSQIIILLYTPVVAVRYRKKLGGEAVVLLTLFHIAPIIGILVAMAAYYDYSYIMSAAVLVFITEFMQKRRIREQQAERTALEALKGNYERIFALEDDFESLYDLEIETGHYDVFVRGNFYRNNVLDRISPPGDYFRQLRGNIDSVVYEEDREDLYRVLSREGILGGLSEADHFDRYYRIITENGPVWLKMRIVYKDASKKNAIIGVFNAESSIEAMEIAEQKEKLEESLSFTNYFLNTYISAYYLDLNTRRFSVYKEPKSELGRKLLGGADYLPPVTAFFRQTVHPDDADAIISIVQPEKIRELVRDGEYSHYFRNVSSETERIMKIHIIPGADADHVALGFADVTEDYREQQKRLLGAIPLSRDVLTKANIGLWSFELDEGQAPRMYADDAMLGLLGLAEQLPPEEIYHAWYDHIDENSYDLVTDAVSKMSSGEHAEVQYPWHHPDGHTMIVRCGGVRNPEYTKGIRIEGTHQDVTQTLHFDEEERKREQRQREDEMARVRAEASDKAKTEFLFNMSHDIRTPMNAILGYTDIALNHVNETDRVSDSLKKIKTSGGHLLSLINDILEMSRIEAGKMEIVNSPLNVYEVTEGITNMSLALASTKDIDFRTEILGMDNPYVYADELHTNQIIINLISNAIKYTAPGGKVDYILEQTCAPEDGTARYRITVTDNGIGMSEEFQQHLFESFTREENAAVSRQEGAGLGLAIVKRIVDLAGGTISVRSKQGEGSTFTVELPLRVMDDAAIESFRAERQGSIGTAGKVSLGGRRVLLVEDNEMNREIATEMLKESGLVTDSAENGAAAVDRVREKGAGYYDFILMDIQMPVMNGYEATAAIRGLPDGESVPIIALSANAFKEDVEKSLAAGMNAHVSKPINMQELYGALAEFA